MMFGGRAGTPTKLKEKQAETPADLSPLLASELATEYASLQTAYSCPSGMYLLPSPDNFLRWHGVFFVHSGPYSGSVLRFSLLFPASYPRSAPIVRFDSDVFHPMVDPKTKVWSSRGRLTQWRPKVDHVPHLLHSLKSSFRTSALRDLTEHEAVNKKVWSLYHHSHQTFLSMTSQRSLHSASRAVNPGGQTASPAVPPSPTYRGHTRDTSSGSTASTAEEGPINFRKISEEERELLWAGLKKSLGLEPA